MTKLYRPTSYDDVSQLLTESSDQPLFYAGGTEIMTDYRQAKIKPTVWLDIKQLPEIGHQDEGSIGAAVFLNDLKEPKMLWQVSQGVADHTIRNQLTIGGNICGKLPFREVVLPLLALGAEVEILSHGQMIREPLKERFDKFLRLQPGELVVRFYLPRTELPYRYQRYTVNGSVDYPLLTYLAVKTDQGYFIGLSGFGAIPQYGWFETWDEATILESFTAVSNDRGSADYRKKLLAIELAKGAPDETV